VRLRHTRHAVEEFAQRCAGVRNGAGVDADDPLGAEVGDQSRHRRAGTERDNDMVKVGQLGEELDGAVHVTTGGVGVGATERDDMRDSAIVSHLLGLALDLAVHLLRRGVTRPDELGAGQLIQYEVATVDVGLLSFEHQDRSQSEAGRCGCRQPRVVALRRAGGDHRRRAGGEGLRAGVLQLADLVATAAEPAQVIALEPESVGCQPHRRRQAGC